MLDKPRTCFYAIVTALMVGCSSTTHDVSYVQPDICSTHESTHNTACCDSEKCSTAHCSNNLVTSKDSYTPYAGFDEGVEDIPKQTYWPISIYVLPLILLVAIIWFILIAISRKR
jgi:hypothetical protein